MSVDRDLFKIEKGNLLVQMSKGEKIAVKPWMKDTGMLSRLDLDIGRSLCIRSNFE